MKALIPFLLLFFSVQTKSNASLVQPVFRGYSKINRIIHERVAEENGFELGQYLDKVALVPASGDLLSLLGTYDGADSNSTYRNGNPNSMNMLLWYIALDEFSTDIANQCSGDKELNESKAGVSPLRLKTRFRSALSPLCAWPDASAKTDSALFAFWSAFLSYDAPVEEFQAWKNFFLTDDTYQNMTAKKVISDMGVAALFNPYFLLEQ